MKKSTAIIFGANGQDGYFLIQLLIDKGINVIACSRKSKDKITSIDVTHRVVVEELIRKHQPEYIFHLAANSTTRHDSLFENHATICTGTLNILESVKLFSSHSKVFISGSGLQFQNNELPIKETDPFEARDAYSVCRIQSAYAARYYRSLGIKAYVGYFFNHDSPRRSERHVCQMIAKSVLAIACGENKIIEIGDPAVVKEWAFAGDIVKAIWVLVNQDNIFEATIGSGKGYSIQEYIEECFRHVNKDWCKFVNIREGFKSEYKQLVSDPSTIFSLGWKQETDFKQLVTIMLTQ